MEPFRSFENLLKSTMIFEGVFYALSGIYEILKRINWLKKTKICWVDVIINSLMPKIETYCICEDMKISAKAKMLVESYNEVFSTMEINGTNGNIKMETENF